LTVPVTGSAFGALTGTAFAVVLTTVTGADGGVCAAPCARIGNMATAATAR
jgi:hypothetical protein